MLTFSFLPFPSYAVLSYFLLLLPSWLVSFLIFFHLSSLHVVSLPLPLPLPRPRPRAPHTPAPTRKRTKTSKINNKKLIVLIIQKKHSECFM